MTTHLSNGQLQCEQCSCPSFYLKHSGPHIGAYCKDCNRYFRFIPQNDGSEASNPASEKQQKYALTLMTQWKNKSIPMTATQAGGIIKLFRE